jgi:hypothetical protein
MSLAAWAPGRSPVGAQEEFDLSEVLTTADGSLSVRYPAGWVAYGDGSGTQVFGQTLPPGHLMLGTSDAALASDWDALERDEVSLILFAPPSVAYAYPVMFSGEFKKAESALDLIERVMLSSDDRTVFGVPEETELSGRPAVIVRYEKTDNRGLAVAIDFDGAYTLAMAGGPVDGFADHEPLVLAILDTLTYIAPEGPVVFITWARDLTLAYPPDWLVTEIAPGLVVIGNGTADLDVLEQAEDAVFVLVMTEMTIPDIFGETGDPAEVASELFDYQVAGEEGVERVARDRPVDDDRAYVDFVMGETVGYVLAREYEGGMLVIWVLAGQDAVDDYADEIDAIIESIVYTPLAEPVPSGDE